MAIIQISKQQQRSGNLVDLPQLSEAEFGWASDEKRLFIGKETPNENIEVLTSYSRIDFSQIEGSIGNLSISNATVANGQILAYNGSDWVNRGGSAGGFISLGNVSNVQITGGAINYILTTDGLGNLSWTPKGALYSNIIALSNATPIVMTVANTTPYVNDAQVTITGVTGVANSNVNGLTFYVQLASNFPTTGNVSLYSSANAVGPANGTSLTYTNSPNAIATSTIGGGGAGGLVAGTTNSVQYNDGAGFAGGTDFTWNGSLLYVNGTANVVNLNATSTVTASRLISNIATGSGLSPLVVSSNVLVANLNADLLDGYDTSVAVSPITVVVRDASGNVLANNVNTNRIFNGTSNIVVTSGGNVSTTVASTERIRATTDGAEIFGNLLASNVYANSGTIGASLLTGTLTTAAQPNITSVGTLTGLTIAANGDITMSGTDSNINGVNIVTAGFFIGSGNNLTNLNGSNISSGTLAQARLANSNVILGSTALTLGTTTTTIAGLSSVTSTTFVGSLTGAATTAGTVTTAAQPNITSVGTLTSLAITGNISVDGNVAVTGSLLASTLTGTLSVLSASQPNVTSVGTLTSLAVTGNITSANITTSTHVIRSVATAISAAGTVQGDATALTKDINVVSTVSAGQGVRLPTAVAGMVIIVNNTSATSMNVYPATSASINSLATNTAYTHVAGASLQYYAISSSQWYTIGATYS